MKRPLIYLLGAIAIAAVVLFIERPGRTPGDQDGVRRPFQTLDPAKVDRIEIERLLNGITLSRAGAEWVIGERTPADATKVNEALAAVRDLTTTSLVSTNPEKQGLFQVNQLGLQVRAYDAAGHLLAHAIVGKQGPDFFSTYLRQGSQDRVYLTRTALAGHFPTMPAYWRSPIANRPPWLHLRPA